MTESTPRRIAFTVLTIVFALGAFGGLFGIALFTAWFNGEEGGIHRVHYLGFGILFGVLLTSPAVALARRPEGRPSAFLRRWRGRSYVEDVFVRSGLCPPRRFAAR